MSLGIFDLVGVIMLVMAGTSFMYLLRVKNKSSSSWMLLWFFLCVILSSIATILTNIGTTWDWAFAPSQDALLILGSVFLVRFAYSYPESDQPGEARWVAAFFLFLALAALTYAASFAIQYFANLPGGLDENQAFYLLTPSAILLMVLVFFRRSIHWSAQTQLISEIEAKPIKPALKSLFKPSNRSAIALRNYGLSLTIGLIPVVTVIDETVLPAVVASFIFNFGAVMAIAVLMLTYLNHAPEPVTISAKLVGISLVSVLLILGLAGVAIRHTNPSVNEHNLVATFITLVLLSSLLIILVFPFFFRTALLDPLGMLLAGVKLANEGDLDIQVAVQYDDEIGFLTRSFNQMVASLNKLTRQLESKALHLEDEVREHTLELVQTNEQLEKENKERENAEIRLNQQLLFQQSLAGCSQTLLQAVEDESSQQEVLNQALEHLRSGAQASRAYIIRTFDDPKMGMCAAILAEVCAPGIFAHIDNPANQKVPLSRFPPEMVEDLAESKPYGGPVKRVLVSRPWMLENFLSQKKPLLSFICFPIFDQNRWWGFVGFDDCSTEREWDEMEISILRTASEMIGNTLQRWDIETQLRETLDELDLRVQERTAELIQSNIKLNEEIQHRQSAQNDLETRLQIEEMLAAISARLLEPTQIRANIAASLENMAGIMNAGRIFLAEFDLQSGDRVREYSEWHRPELPPVSEDVLQFSMTSLIGLRELLQGGETVYIDDTSQFPNNQRIDLQFLQDRDVHSLVLSPIVIDRSVQAVLGCSNLQASADTVQGNLRALDLVAGMLKSLLQREHLIQTLEEQVAERTRQLTTFLDMAMLSDQAQDLADLLQPTLFSITQIAACDAAAIHIIDEERSSLELIAQRGFPPRYLQPLREINIDAEFAAWLVEADPYEALRDLDIGSIFMKPFRPPVFRAFFANRLSTGGKPLGLLSCYRVEDQPFSPFQATLLNSLGELLGIIVENHRLRIEAGELAAVEERQRLAREIHDVVSQSVYSLSLFARSASDALEESNEGKLLANLQDIEGTALQAMREMRLLLYQLRAAGQDKDFATALEARFQQVENRLGIQATFELGGDIILPSQIQQEVWRIVIEALNNAVKNANPSRIQVGIICQDEILFVSIQDDGIGFDLQYPSPGMGLENIQARTETLGGQLDITSELGQGTQIKLKIPMACMDAQEGD